MIKINLSTDKQQVNISNVGGLDLTQVKFVPAILFTVLIYVPDFTLVPIWEEEIAAINQQASQKTTEERRLNEKIKTKKDEEKKINELKAQEENLAQKLTAVKEAISQKRNPGGLFLYIAKNIPPELWIKELTITKQDMSIKGEALDYTSIGNFVNSLRSSIFIKDASIAGTSSTVREADKKRIESFELKFSIARFE